MNFLAHVHDGDYFADNECCGDGHCDAPIHVHGCYADDDGARCDDPAEHNWERA